MLQPYIPFLLLLGFVMSVGAAIPLLSHFLGPRRPTAVKRAPYESGMPPLGSARERFSVKFYVVAMLFILFDIETVFLIPWGAIYFGAPGAGGPGMGFLLVEMMVFLLLLFAGYVYVWKRGAFQWD
jgi:NADH-quinone oxidoreductase subunit A